MKITENIIKEINIQIKESLEEWSEVLSDADCDGWAVDLLFDEKDLLNILQMFTSIWSNSAIKRGIFTEENVLSKMKLFRTAINDVFGVDTITLADSVLGNNNCELN